MVNEEGMRFLTHYRLAPWYKRIIVRVLLSAMSFRHFMLNREMNKVA